MRRSNSSIGFRLDPSVVTEVLMLFAIPYPIQFPIHVRSLTQKSQHTQIP
ncbi:unnamed protein product [Acidithrix sp. C25]|nr:unnamed protein product [Acidithrix sp. C25]